MDEAETGLNLHICHGFKRTRRFLPWQELREVEWANRCKWILVLHGDDAETEKERCKFKICLSDKLFLVVFLPLPIALICSLGQPSCVGIVPYTRRWKVEQVRKQRNPLVSFIRDNSFTDITRQKIFKFRVQRGKRWQLFFPVLQLSTFLLVSMPPASAFRCFLTDLKATETKWHIKPKLLCHSSQSCSSLQTTLHLQLEPVPLL